MDFPSSNPFISFYQLINLFNPFFTPSTSTSDNECAHIEDKVEDDANLPSTIYVHAHMLNASHPAHVDVDQSLTHAMTHEPIRSTPALARTHRPHPRLGMQAKASTQLHAPRQTHHAISSVTFHPSLHSDLRVSGQRQDAGSQFSQLKSTMSCSRSTPRPKSHSFSPSRVQGFFEHVEEFEESTSALPQVH